MTLRTHPFTTSNMCIQPQNRVQQFQAGKQHDHHTVSSKEAHGIHKYSNGNETMIVYASITRFENCTVFCESAVAGMEGNFAVVSSKLLQAFRSSNSLPDGARRTLVHRNSSSHNDSSSATRAVEVEGIRIPFCTQGLVWGTDSWFGDDPLDEPSLVQVDAYFHILKEDGVVYLSLTNEAGKPTLNYTFLEAIRKDFTSRYSPSRLEAVRAYELEKSFGPTLSSIIHYFNTHPNAGSTETKVMALTAHVEDLKNVIGDNIQLMLRREDYIESLASKATELEGQAQIFRKQTTQVKEKVKKKYHKMFFIQCVLVSGIAALLGMIVWAILSRVNGTSQ